MSPLKKALLVKKVIRTVSLRSEIIMLMMMMMMTMMIVMIMMMQYVTIKHSVNIMNLELHLKSMAQGPVQFYIMPYPLVSVKQTRKTMALDPYQLSKAFL